MEGVRERYIVGVWKTIRNCWEAFKIRPSTFPWLVGEWILFLVL